ncbi:MAG: SRPBCC family protein [Flavobacteriales bacterium]|jgi:effector-binding domain-containing protein|nr:SRPBCC family protein [Flavobacteriales bacterium]
MRVLKTILFILIALVAIVCILGMIGPDTYRIERSVTINAPTDLVYDHVSSLGAMDKWSPWNAYDKGMKKSMEGSDGTVGAIYKWEGNDQVGKGEQRIDSLAPNSFVKTHLHFREPWESECDALIELAPEAEGTKVTWAMVGENGFMSKLMGKFMDMDAMVGSDFEKGLALLKEQAEAAAAAVKKADAAYVIETLENPEMVFVGKRDPKVKWSDLAAFYSTHFQLAGGAIGKAKLEMTGAPCGVFWAWNETDSTADMLAGFPVKAGADLKVEGFDVHVIPAGKMLKTPYYGAYDKNMAAHMAMDAYIKANNLTHFGNVIEEYITDPTTEKDTTKWLTNIYYMVK